MPEAFVLPAELTIYSVGELAPNVRDHLARSHDVDSAESVLIDASAVQEVDAAGIQLLLSLANGLARETRLLQLIEPSEPLRRACAGLGVSALLLPSISTGTAS